MPGPALMAGKVKAVLSGDTLVLVHPSNPKSERTISLAFVSAPRMRREGDEPFGFESRSHLIQSVIGKTVHFRVLYTIPTGANRDYGVVTLDNGTSWPEEGVKEGWLKLRDDAAKKNADDEYSQGILRDLEAAESKAKADAKGMWSGKGGQIDVAHEIPDTKAFVEENKGKTLEAVAERILSGDRMIARFLLSPTNHIQTLVLLAGVRAPSTARTNTSDGKPQPAEPFGEEAQLFLESRINQRTLNLQPVGTTPQGQLVCIVAHKQGGDMAVHLLQNGLARCVDHHSTMLAGGMGKLRAAEKAAKDKKLALFRDHVAAKGGAESEVTVVRVQAADTLFVRNRSGTERRIQLSSVRQPKPTDPAQAPFQAEAKEYLRKRLIGKHVKITIDGKKPATEGFEEREVATVAHGGKNVALALVEAGWASAIRHRRDDTDRSPVYDDLLAAEEKAQTEKKGMWSGKPSAARQYVDYSESLQKAKMQASVLQRQKRIPGVVDFVRGASRFAVLIPRENAKITLVLSCIRAPRAARNPGDASEPCGQEALEFATRKCMQRDVEVDVEGTDKVGGFIGTLWVNRENFTKQLVEEGLASVHAYSAEQSSHGPELFAAEERAKAERRGIWKDYDPAQEEEEAASAAVAEAADEAGAQTSEEDVKYEEMVVTHIDPATLRLKVQVVGKGTSALEEMTSRFRSFHMGSNAPLAGDPKAGDWVSAKFSADGQWYRARVRRNDRERREAEVLFVDFGNEEKAAWKTLRPLPPQFDAKTLKPQAVEAALSFCHFPASREYADEAAAFLQDALGERPVIASVNRADRDGTLHVTLFEKDLEINRTDSFNARLVGEGLAMLPPKLPAWERGFPTVLADLKRRQEQAKDDRKGMWEYGDITED